MIAADQRALDLAKEFPAAAQPLRFAAGLIRVQSQMRAGELSQVAEAAGPLLRYCAQSGPSELAADAREALSGGFAERVQTYWETGEFDYLARAALAPYARTLREMGLSLERHGGGACIFCTGGAWVASRRGGSTLEGAQRMLHCALCGMSWQVRRIFCPRCGEENPDKLPNFSAPEHVGARIEACETCKGYVKSIELSDDARRIPEIDDLTSISLDLWAVEQGFERLEPGLAGL